MSLRRVTLIPWKQPEQKMSKRCHLDVEAFGPNDGCPSPGPRNTWGEVRHFCPPALRDKSLERQFAEKPFGECDEGSVALHLVELQRFGEQPAR